jgi:hypothetical protein
LTRRAADRAQLDGKHVSNKFITQVNIPLGVAAAGGYLCWAD